MPQSLHFNFWHNPTIRILAEGVYKLIEMSKPHMNNHLSSLCCIRHRRTKTQIDENCDITSNQVWELPFGLVAQFNHQNSYGSCLKLHMHTKTSNPANSPVTVLHPVQLHKNVQSENWRHNQEQCLWACILISGTIQPSGFLQKVFTS